MVGLEGSSQGDPQRRIEVLAAVAVRDVDPYLPLANGVFQANPEAVAAFTGKRRAALRNAIPAWANEQAILDIYRECRNHPDHHVDHIVPLVSKIVCGLHCEANLRIIPAVENYSKNNRRWPDMP